MRYATKLAAVLVGLVLMAGCATTKPTPPPAQKPPAAAANDKKSEIKKYSEVITKEAKTDPGLFTVHRVADKLYFEVPDSLLGDDMLLVTRIARTADQIGYGGEQANSQVVRWEKQDKNILLRTVSFSNVATEEDPIYKAVESSNFPPIVSSFKIEALGKDSLTYVIDVTALFTDDVPVLGLQKARRDQYRVRRLDRARSYITSANSYPKNVEVRHVLTYDAAEPPSQNSTGTISLEMAQSMVMLPEDPMMPRLCDARVGFFSRTVTDYSADAQRADTRCMIVRWRLEPKDPEAYKRGELVEPKQPIVYYIDPATPMKWRPYLKQGVEDWQVAFEAAGFKNAILAKDPPSPEEDPEFSPEDARYSVIRYFASPIQNAYGPNVHDPRTGQILESDIGWYHNVMNLLRNWYFVQTAAANPAARGVQFDDVVMGELIRFVSSHEVGHTLGLPHNWGSSAAVPVDSLRSPTYTSAHGTAPSIMDYARFNYVAQPGDRVTNFYPRIGPYDIWAIKWGYTWLPEAETPQEERPILNAWVKERADDPVFFYGRQTGAKIDPRSQNEDLGDDAVKASQYGVANLKRILPNLMTWTRQEGEDFEQLDELYGQVLAQWSRYMGHVAANVGGVYETYKTYDQDGPVYMPVPAARQKAALDFLSREAFQTPEWMLDADILRRIEHAGALDRVRAAQVSVLNQLLDPQKLARLIEAEAIDAASYTAPQLLADVRGTLWSELARGQAIDVYRRALQRGYLERMRYLMTEEVPAVPAQFRQFVGATPVNVAQSDIRAFARGELELLKRDVQQAIGRTRDRATQLHLRDVVYRIDQILDPKEG